MMDFEEDEIPGGRVLSQCAPRRRHLMLPLSMVDDLADSNWDEADLRGSPRYVLRILAKLMGSRMSGTIEDLTTNLLAARQVHLKLAPYQLGEHDRLAMEMSRDNIRWLAREARVPRSLNKRTVAWFLLLWRSAVQMNRAGIFNALIQSNGDWESVIRRADLSHRPRIANLIRRTYARIDANRNRRSNTV